MGNIATGEAALDLARSGADAIKVGIGPSKSHDLRSFFEYSILQNSMLLLNNFKIFDSTITCS